MTRSGGTPREPRPAELVYPGESEEPLLGGYFVSAYPPFGYWRESPSDSYRARLERPGRTEAPFGLYLHVPFCAQRCQYCYYRSYEDQPGEVDRYLAALARELELCAEKPYLSGRLPEVVYFGGGTPSLLSESRVRSLLESAQRSFPWSSTREVTFECAPRSVSRAKLDLLRESGVTRLSLGAQQLDDEVLRLNGRIHQVEDVERALGLIRRAGFEVVNVDLIAGLVGETDRSFHDSLERLLRIGPDSVTIYLLEIPLDTPLSRSVREGRLEGRLPGWDRKRARLREGLARLEEAGYTLRSAYTAVRDPERHGFVYQDEQYRGADLLGVGVSSFSYLGGVHHQNLADLGLYLKELGENRLPIGRALRLSVEERFVRELVLQLKLGRVDGRRLRRRYGIDLRVRFREALEGLEQRGLLTLEGETLTVTRTGLLFVDRWLSELYLPEHREAAGLGDPAYGSRVAGPRRLQEQVR